MHNPIGVSLSFTISNYEDSDFEKMINNSIEASKLTQKFKQEDYNLYGLHTGINNIALTEEGFKDRFWIRDICFM